MKLLFPEALQVSGEEYYRPVRLYYHLFLFDRRDAAAHDERKTLARTRSHT